MNHRFWIYSSAEHWYMRLLFTFFPVFIACEAYMMQFSFLYFVSAIMLIISLYVFSFVNCRISFSQKGITVIRMFKSNIYIPWEDVNQIGFYKMNYLGSYKAKTIIFFSKDKVNVFQLSKDKSLPVLSANFIFVLNQPKLKDAILQNAPSHLLHQVNW